MDIKIYDRQKKELFKEEVSGEKFLDFLYDNRVGVLLREGLVKRKIFQSIVGLYCDLPLSKKNIPSFIKKQAISIDEALVGAESYKSFNDFFVRKLKKESRPVDMNPDVLVSPGDGRLLAFQNIKVDALIQIKGIEYSLKDLISDESLAKEFEGGTLLILRLNPSDYHRFHFSDSGFIGKTNKIKGSFYSVNPVALKNIPSLYLKNKREWSLFESDNFGKILIMEVGATSVGSIIQTYEENSRVNKGDEKGYFKFGGSTTVLFIKKDVIEVDEDILEYSNQFIETKVKFGERIAKKK